MTFDPEVWARVPFGFWTFTLFAFGCVVGSFLNVCIHRMPRGESIVSPPSHCPHCNYSIPWYLNIPLLTWLYLRGRCANCAAPIAVRYFLVELLTGVTFAACWLKYGDPAAILSSALIVLVYCLLIAGLIASTFIDFEHYIIPDEITLGGIAAGFFCSFLIPGIHHLTSPSAAMRQSLLGIAVGGGVVYGILRAGKLLFGRQKIPLSPNTKIIFTETVLRWPDHEVEYGDVFYRPSDSIELNAARLEMIDRCYANVALKLRQDCLQVGQDTFDPENVLYMEAVADEIILPREAMGFGDVKFMAAIGAFLGWQAVLFSIAVSSMVGSVVGLSLIALKKREWSNRLPYGPYIAIAAIIYLFAGADWLSRVFGLH